ncbi:MAG: hypothetical protein PF488_04650 [Patescibacteria group bacterium]|jgi:shikimate 5-dehydrogenase|nr:hypothetical protein [Patescibacteria group bacterium]
MKKGCKLLKSLSSKAIVADIILRSVDTPLISEAKKLKLKTMDGIPMVISQAALAFYISYGREKKIGFSQIYQKIKKLV